MKSSLGSTRFTESSPTFAYAWPSQADVYIRHRPGVLGHPAVDRTFATYAHRMAFIRRNGSGKRPISERMGLDSVRFDTLGLSRQPDEEPNHRFWLGPGLGLSENWFPIPPDMPSLDEDEIRAMYDGLLGDRQDADGRSPRVLDVAVNRENVIPAVCTLFRLPDDNRYTFVGAITLLLAECSWVIKLQGSEGGITGVREALAFHRFSGENPELSIDERLSTFDPYDELWDFDDEPLTSVRRAKRRILDSLQFDAAVLQASTFDS